MFQIESKTTGNKSLNHAAVYNTRRWVRLRTKRMSESPFTCESPNCPALANVLDHIIPITKGGSIWDRRNHQKLCDRHHNIKRGREAHGQEEASIGTSTGRIPLRHKDMPSHIEGESYLTKPKI